MGNERFKGAIAVAIMAYGPQAVAVAEDSEEEGGVLFTAASDGATITVFQENPPTNGTMAISRDHIPKLVKFLMAVYASTENKNVE